MSGCNDGAWIQTYTKKKISLLRPRPEDFDIEDIVYSLSNQVRFVGHPSKPYTVGQHSILVHEICRKNTLSPQVLLQALLHDASEAYLGDVSRPLKRLPEMAGYRKLERRLQNAIYDRFGLPRKMHGLVRYADQVMVATEQRDLMWPPVDDWGLKEEPDSSISVKEPMDRADVRAELRTLIDFEIFRLWGTQCVA